MKNEDKTTTEATPEQGVACGLVQQLVVPTDDWGSAFWRCNLPLQMWPNDDNTFGVVDYMARKESVVRLDKTVTPEELSQFCKNTSVILRNLAERFEMLGRGEIDSIYYADEGLDT